MDESEVSLVLEVRMFGPITVTKITDVAELQSMCKSNYDAAREAAKKIKKVRERLKVARAMLAETRRDHEGHCATYDGHPCSCGADEWNSRVDEV